MRVWFDDVRYGGNELAKVELSLRGGEGEPERFESELSARSERFCVVTDSVFSAYILALNSLGYRTGDTVVIGSLCRSAALAALVTIGARVVVVDCSPVAPTSPLALDRALEKKPRFAINVGSELSTRLKASNVLLITENYSDESDYTVVDLGGFCGLTTRGGAIIFKDEQCCNRAKEVRDGRDFTAQNGGDFGVNIPVKMSRVEASIGRSRLEKSPFPKSVEPELYQTYTKAFDGLRGVETLPKPLNEAFCGFPLKICRSDTLTARSFCAFLQSEKVFARTLNLPVHLQMKRNCEEEYSPRLAPTFFPHENGLDVSLELFRSVVLLPSHARISRFQRHKVVSAARFFIDQKCARK